jgi:hypothetical protein
LLATAVVALAAGCVGGSDGLNRAEYVSHLNAMCRDFAAREARIGEPHTVSDLAERGPRIASAFEQAIADKILELAAPSAIAGEAARLRKLAFEQRDVLRGLAEAAGRHDLARVQALAARNAKLNSDATEVARRLGADACSGS